MTTSSNIHVVQHHRLAARKSPARRRASAWHDMFASTGARASVRVTDAFVASRARRRDVRRFPARDPYRRGRVDIRGGATADDASDAEVHPERMRPDPDYDAQRKLRMSWMHWLHDKPKHARAGRLTGSARSRRGCAASRRCASASYVSWRTALQNNFAEPGRDVIFGDDVHVGADVHEWFNVDSSTTEWR